MTEPTDPFELAELAAADLTGRLGTHRAAVVLGSGWADVSTGLGTTLAELPMSQLTGAPTPTVLGHDGVIRSVLPTGSDDRPPVLVMAGRSHLYEGHDAATVVHSVRSAVLSGCTTVVLTNAAGSLRPDVGIGQPVLISDQLNLSGSNPMCGGDPPERFPSRFTDLTDLYSSRLRKAIGESHPDLVEGVYAGLLGGSFETPAEIRMLRSMGADLVGMSTVLESIAAHHLGAEVVGLSLVTNLAAGLQDTVNHLEVLDAGRESAGRLVSVLASVLRDA